MDSIYDTMESEIDLITRRVTSVKIGDRLKLIDKKLQSVSSKLIDLDFASNHVFKEGGEVMNFLDKLSSLSSKLQSTTTEMHKKMKNRISGTLDKQRKFGFFSTILMFLVIIGIFVCISKKLDSIINRKDIGIGNLKGL